MSFKNRLVSIFSYFKRGIGNKKAIISLVFLTPVLAIFLLNSFFPSEVLRVRAEEFLSGQLGGTARISHISFVPLMGLKVEDLHIDSAQIGRITVNRLILDYNLLALLKGRLHINSVQLADAKVEISLPPANTTAINEKTAPAEPLQLPSLPIKIKVKEFSIKKTDFKVEIDKTRTIEIQDMNVNIACDLTTRESELGGELTVDLIKIREGTKTLQLPIASRFDIRADLAREKLEVENFVFSAGSIMTIRLNGLLTDILEEREIRANLFLEKLDLKPLGTTLADFIPAEYRDAVVLGVFSGSAKLDGSLKNSFDGSIDLLAEGNTVKAEFSGDEISFTRMTVDLSVPTVNIQTGELKGSFESAVTGLSIASQKNEALLHPFDFQFALRGFNLVHFVPVSASASLQIPKISGRYQSLSSHLDGFEIQTGITDVDPLFHTGYGSFDLAISGVDAKDELLDFTLFPTKVHFSLPRIELHGEVPDVKKVLLEIESPGGNFKAHSVKKISITASGEASRDTSVQLSTKVSGEVFELLLEPGYRVSFPAAASLSLTGNLRNQKLAIDHLNFSSKTVGEATLKGRVEAAIEGRDKFAFLGDLKIMPDIPEMQKHLPPPTQKKLEIKKSGSTPDLVHVTLEGNLGGDYLPEEAHVLGGIELHKLTVNNTSPELGGALEKLDFQFESDYEKASGIIKANGTSKALFSHLRKGQEEFFVKRLGLDISSYVSGNFNLETSAFKNISGGLLFRGEGIDISEKNLPLGLSSVLVSANVKGDAKDLKTIQSASISTEATVKGVQIQGAEAESAHATISVKTGPSGILNSVSVLDFKGKKIVWKEKGARATVDTLSLSLGTRQNLENNEFILSGFRVAADDFFALTGEGSYRMPENFFTLASTLEKFNIEKSILHLDGKKAEMLRKLSPQGLLSASVKLSGTIPDYSKIDPIDTPVFLDAGVRLKNGGGVYENLRLSGANMSQSIRFTPEKNRELFFENRFWLDTMELREEGSIRPLKKMHTTVTLSLNDFNSLRIEQLQGGVDGAEFHLTGNLSGLKAFVPPLTKTKQEGLQKIYAHIQAGASLQPAAFTDLLAKENISSDGVVSVDVQALKEESGTVSLSTTINTSDLSFKNEDILVTGVTVSIPVKKKIFLEGSKTAKPKKKQSALSPPSYTPYRNEKNIRIENITNRSATVKNITGQIELKGNSLTIQDLAMNLLDGGGGGNINIDTGERPGTKITFYFSDIDVNRLLPEISQVKGNAAISGVLGLTVVLRHIEEKLDFETIEFSVHMTKIGRESLDRILLLIDPDESKPAIIHARSKLKLANPSSARLVISGGFLSLNIDFQEGLISSLELNRIPVGSIRKLKFAQQLLEPFQAMSAPLKLMASETYKIGPTGKPVFSE